MIHQELSVLPNLIVAENLFLGNEKINKLTKKLDKKTMNSMCRDYLQEIGCNVKPNEYVKNISIGEMQMLEIAKAISKNSKIIIMDEPSTALTESETEKLFKVVERLTSKNIAIIYIPQARGNLYYL